MRHKSGRRTETALEVLKSGGVAGSAVKRHKEIPPAMMATGNMALIRKRNHAVLNESAGMAIKDGELMDVPTGIGLWPSRERPDYRGSTLRCFYSVSRNRRRTTAMAAK
jgi:hypothetical protein